MVFDHPTQAPLAVETVDGDLTASAPGAPRDRSFLSSAVAAMFVESATAIGPGCIEGRW
jgi:hypothetical protein